MAEHSQIFSSYYSSLDEAAKTRYREKLQMLGGIKDPYIYWQVEVELNSAQKVEWYGWPEVEYPDIYNYVIASPSPHTSEELKAWNGTASSSMDGSPIS